jgi:hypothetical protein
MFMSVIAPSKGRRNTRGVSIQQPDNLNKCYCENKEPVLKTFSLKTVSGPGSLLVTSCDRCSAIITWTHEQSQNSENFKYSFYLVVSVNAVHNKPDHMTFVCILSNGLSFPVMVPSKVEKVNNAMKNPSVIVGKYAQLEYTTLNDKGIPVSPTVKAVVGKEKLPQILN